MKNGRCRLHGGKSLSGEDVGTYTHGAYSKVWKNKAQALRDLADSDVLTPLQLAEGLARLAVERAAKVAAYYEKLRLDDEESRAVSTALHSTVEQARKAMNSWADIKAISEDSDDAKRDVVELRIAGLDLKRLKLDR